MQSLRSIRLIRLQPSSELSAPLDINLLEVSLEDFPSEINRYEALSYVWGAPSGTVPCMCDGKELLITPNCNEALQYLRLPKDDRVLWVDAICIDQGSSEESVRERNVQISLMGEVYRTADRTLCWLGRGEEYTPGMFKFLRRVGSCPSQRELKKLLNYDGKLKTHMKRLGTNDF